MLTLSAAVAAWAGVWAAADAWGWDPRPLPLLALLVLVLALGWLVGAVGITAPPLPRAELRVTPSSPVGEDQRLLRHQLQLEDAAGDPPSCRPVLTRISELARERVRLRHGTDVGSRPLGERLTAVLTDPPPDRTHLSPGELARLVDDVEAL